MRCRVWPPQTEFHLVTVIDPQLETSILIPTLSADQWIRQHDANAGEWVCRLIEHVRGELATAGLKADEHILEGDPKKELLHFLETMLADCIFLGAQGQHHGERRALGTVATAVAARAHCSVEIVRWRLRV